MTRPEGLRSRASTQLQKHDELPPRAPGVWQVGKERLSAEEVADIESLLTSNNNNHGAKVQDVCTQMLGKPQHAKVTVKKKAPMHNIGNSDYKQDKYPIVVDGLDDILCVDTRRGWVVMEAQVTNGAATKHCLPMGVLPPVIPESPCFTVAGMING